MTTKPMMDGKSELQPPELDASGKVTKEGRGVSLVSNQAKSDQFGGSHKVTSVPEGLAIEQRGNDKEHFECVGKRPTTQAEYDKKKAEVKTEKVEPLKSHEHG